MMEFNALSSLRRQMEFRQDEETKKMKLEIPVSRKIDDRAVGEENMKVEKKEGYLALDKMTVLSSPLTASNSLFNLDSSTKQQPNLMTYFSPKPRPQSQDSPQRLKPVSSASPSKPSSISKPSQFNPKATISSPILNWSLSSIRPHSNPSPKKFDLIFDHSASVHNISSESDISCLNSQFKKSYFKDLRIIGQFNRGFILAYLSGSKDLFIIDQHAADEKYLFETLQHKTTIHKQPLIAPLKLKLSVSEEIIVMGNLEACELNGFKIKYDNFSMAGERLYLLTLPLSKDTVFTIDDAYEMLRNLHKYSYISNQQRIAHLSRPSRFRSMFASRACRKAVMIGDALDSGHMKKIIERLSELEHPWSCPHGRPTMRHLINTYKLDR
jgi:DNA mismatch repair ATPase MutL